MKYFSKFFSVFYAAFFINLFLVVVSTLFFVYKFFVLGGFFALLWVGVMLFFRDPERSVPDDEEVILSSADGKVVKITQGSCPGFSGEVNKVLIFMSPLDVHRNRAPIAGVVKEVEHINGKFIPAFKDAIEDINERNRILFIDGSLKVQVTQIAGILARRIVCSLKGGETVSKGEQFGLIRFGSANEIVFPVSYGLEISEGDRVVAGETIVARKCK